MLGKYDFAKEHLPQVLQIFDSTTAYAFTWVDLLIDFIEENDLKFEQFSKVKQHFLTINYLDEFQEVRDEFYFAYEDATYYFLKLENNRKKFDFINIKIKLFTAKEAFLITDNLIRFCYDYIKLEQKAPTTQIASEFILKKVKSYLQQLLSLKNSELEIFSDRQYEYFQELLEVENLEIWDEALNAQIELFETKWVSQQAEVKFGNEMYLNFWKIFGLLIQMRALIDIIFVL